MNNSLDWAIHYEKAKGSHNIVPDSCCVAESKGCGYKYRADNGTIYHPIYTKVCLNRMPSESVRLLFTSCKRLLLSDATNVSVYDVHSQERHRLIASCQFY